MFAYTPIYLLVIVLLLSLIKRIGPITFPLWLLMIIAAVLCIVFQNASLTEAYKAIDFDIIGYLLGVFILGSALEDSRLIEKVALILCRHSSSQNRILLKLIYLFGISSAILLNDTMAIIGAAVAVILIKSMQVASKPYIYATAFSVTIGSVMSPIGNPQNLLIANAFTSDVFLYFISYLLIPTLICLYLCYWVISKTYKFELSKPINIAEDNITLSPFKRNICIISLSLFLSLILAKVIIGNIDTSLHIPFAAIALAPAILILLAYPARRFVIQNTDWRTIVFFIGMFILIHAVWQTGVLQSGFSGREGWFNEILPILIISVILSQFISNAPMVILILPLIIGSGGHQSELLALAVGSTFAGNFTILGAASNIIIFQYAIRKGIDCFSFKSFILIGALITLPSLIIYYFFLSF